MSMFLSIEHSDASNVGTESHVYRHCDMKANVCGFHTEKQRLKIDPTAELAALENEHQTSEHWTEISVLRPQ